MLVPLVRLHTAVHSSFAAQKQDHPKRGPEFRDPPRRFLKLEHERLRRYGNLELEQEERSEVGLCLELCVLSEVLWPSKGARTLVCQGFFRGFNFSVFQ